jgi:hypothetical protein
MKDFLKWGLIGSGVAYVLFRDQLAAVFGSSPSSPAAAAAASSPSSPAAAAPRAATDAAGTKARLLAAAQVEPAYIANSGRMSSYQWGYLYSIVRGVPSPDAGTLGIEDAAMLLSLDEYWTAATSHGLSGIQPRPRRSSASRAWGN